MSNPINGVIAVIGSYGVGKTWFCLSSGYQPNDICIINDDTKTPPQADWGQYFNMRLSTQGMKPDKAYETTISKIMDKIQPTKVIIWDTWTRFGSLCADYVQKYPGKFRDSYAAMGQIAKAEQFREARKLEMDYINELKSKCDMLFLTFHTKALYLDNKAVIGKSSPEGSRAISQASDLRIWLTPSHEYDAPVGLVLKNIAKAVIGEDGIQPVQMLPKRIEPCDWGGIKRYYDNPFGSQTSVNDDEIPDEYELSMIEGTLTAEEKRIWLNTQSPDEVINGLVGDNPIHDINRIQQCITDNGISGPPPMVINKVLELLPDVTREQIIEAMNNE